MIITRAAVQLLSSPLLSSRLVFLTSHQLRLFDDYPPMVEKEVDSDKQHLVSLLEAHGNSFLSSFGPLPGSSSLTKSRKQVEQEPARERRKTVNDDYDGSEVSEEDVKWTGTDSDASGRLEEDDTDSDADHAYNDVDDDEGFEGASLVFRVIQHAIATNGI